MAALYSWKSTMALRLRMAPSTESRCTNEGEHEVKQLELIGMFFILIFKVTYSSLTLHLILHEFSHNFLWSQNSTYFTRLFTTHIHLRPVSIRIVAGRVL